VPGALLDGNLSQGLIRKSLGTTQPGRYVFRVRGGQVLSCTDAAICDDGSPCTAEACVKRPGEEIGECQYSPAREGEVCDDGDACTEKDACAAGSCVGRPKSCDDGNACTEDVCDPALGCTNPPITDGGSCDDGDGCTDSSVCQDSLCTPVSRSCTIDITGAVERRGRVVQVKCKAAPRSLCEGELREALIEASAAVAAPGAEGPGPRPAVVSFFAGRLFSKQKSKAVNAKGRAVLRLKLSREGMKALRVAPGGRLLVVLKARVVPPSGSPRARRSAARIPAAATLTPGRGCARPT
jgi:hypothetical protein